MPSRAYTSFLRTLSLVKPVAFNKVSMPSRAYTSFLRSIRKGIDDCIMCQCPLGLIPHFYRVGDVIASEHARKVSMPSRAYTSFLHQRRLSRLSLIRCVNALSGLYLISTSQKHRSIVCRLVCQCPLGLIPHFYIRKVVWKSPQSM